MPINTNQARSYLRAFDFKRLFIEELGWNNPAIRFQPMQFDGLTFTFTPIAGQGGMVVTLCESGDGNIPALGVRQKIDKYITTLAAEHIIIFVDGSKTSSLWWWVKREQGKSPRPRTHSYHKGQPGDSLLQKLAGIAFDLGDLDDEGKVSIGEVTSRVARAFDVERVTRRFYDQFQIEHRHFLGFLKGVQDIHGRDWYASVMLNRLMFLYFIQKKGFLNSDRDYLRTKLNELQAQGEDRYYRDFLLVLFFKGLACEESERTEAERQLIGSVPYLNGGIFLPHPVEEANPDIQIPDAAFERLFDFFDRYTWHLDDRPLRADNEINPDVLGYIFEKYINQKQMGAYYTKEDITNYICKYTVLPFLLDKVGLNVAQAMSDVDPYIYEAVKTEEYLPTETEREYAARRKRYEQIRADFAAGKIAAVNDLITYNLDIQAFVEDYLRGPEMTATPIMLRRFYEALRALTVLDPTCGSGAFLFAAMNILEPLYELCLDKMAQVVAGKDGSKYPDFKAELERVNQHPNRRYFVLKSIIVNNLYGVDIMDEAVEICKLRLFLKLVAQVEALTPGPSPKGEGESYRKMADAAIVQIARDLRQRTTSAEEIVWEALRDRRLGGLKFRRQHPIEHSPYVVDFFCYECKLGIEIDGEVHAGQQEADRARQTYIESLGYRIVRFTNEQVFSDLKSVLITILRAANLPSPLGEGSGVRALEPLPDIDFNIRAGNTLVGFATKAELDHQPGSGFRLYNVEELLRKVEDADRALANFRAMQTRIGVSAALFKEAKARIGAQLAVPSAMTWTLR